MARLADTRAIVLAAGAGSRMGGPKALMEVGGRPWWRIQADALGLIGVGVVWVVSEEVRHAFEGTDEAPTVLALSDSEAPMFASVLAGLRTLQAAPPSGVFILPIDVPCPEKAVWQRLVERGGVCAPESGGRHGHPLHLDWATAAHAVLTHAGDPTARLDALIQPLIEYIPVVDHAAITNLNTPEDVAAWLRSRKGGGR